MTCCVNPFTFLMLILNKIGKRNRSILLYINLWMWFSTFFHIQVQFWTKLQYSEKKANEMKFYWYWTWARKKRSENLSLEELLRELQYKVMIIPCRSMYTKISTCKGMASYQTLWWWQKVYFFSHINYRKVFVQGKRIKRG